MPLSESATCLYAQSAKLILKKIQKLTLHEVYHEFIENVVAWIDLARTAAGLHVEKAVGGMNGPGMNGLAAGG